MQPNCCTKQTIAMQQNAIRWSPLLRQWPYPNPPQTTPIHLPRNPSLRNLSNLRNVRNLRSLRDLCQATWHPPARLELYSSGQVGSSNAKTTAMQTKLQCKKHCNAKKNCNAEQTNAMQKKLQPWSSSLLRQWPYPNPPQTTPIHLPRNLSLRNLSNLKTF